MRHVKVAGLLAVVAERLHIGLEQAWGLKSPMLHGHSVETEVADH